MFSGAKENFQIKFRDYASSWLWKYWNQEKKKRNGIGWVNVLDEEENFAQKLLLRHKSLGKSLGKKDWTTEKTGKDWWFVIVWFILKFIFKIKVNSFVKISASIFVFIHLYFFEESVQIFLLLHDQSFPPLNLFLTSLSLFFSILNHFVELQFLLFQFLLLKLGQREFLLFFNLQQYHLLDLVRCFSLSLFFSLCLYLSLSFCLYVSVSLVSLSLSLLHQLFELFLHQKYLLSLLLIWII